MFRHKDIKIFLFSFIIISLIGAFATFFIDTTAFIVFVISISLILLCVLLFVYNRYREINKLSDYLKRVLEGEYNLNICDNTEGELSILKSEIYKVTIMLCEQAELLKKDKEYLVDCVSDISHQIKTPLTSMLMMTDLLYNKDIDEQKRIEFLNSISTQLERLKWLVSSLLKLSKLDAGTVYFKSEKINANKLILKCEKILAVPLDIKSIDFKIICNEDVFFDGDFNWYQEALINILKNCVEHTDKNGKITVTITNNPVFSEIKINDNGKGIDKQDLPYIFKRFYRGKNASSDSVGIGLAMAHSIISKQNGSITVNSNANNEKDTGTSFLIRQYKSIV